MNRARGRIVTIIVLAAFFSIQQPVRAGPRPFASGLLINLPAFTVYLYLDGQPVRAFSIAIGRPGHPSPTGDFFIANQVINPTWYPPDGRPPVPPGPGNPLGPRWLGLTRRGYGLHGTSDSLSIGKAVSLGCIRLKNADIIELFDIVRTGWPVRVIYDTMPVDVDRDNGEPVLTIYPDVYGLGTNTPDRLQGILDAGAPGQAAAAEQIDAWLAQAEQGPVKIPLSYTLRLNGLVLGRGGFWRDGELFVPLRPLAEALGHAVSWDAIAQAALVDGQPVAAETRDGRSYIPITIAGQTWGVRLAGGELAGVEGLTLDLYRVEVALNGSRLVISTRWQGDHPVVPLREMAGVLSIPVAWDATTGQVLVNGRPVPATMIDGQAYAGPDELAAVFGLNVNWRPEDGLLDLQTP